MAVIESVPNVVFKTRVRDESVEGPNPFRWQDVTTQELFGGKRVVLFSLPGAFTPTCSSTHLPRYEELYDEIKATGGDEVVCISVNDVTVNQTNAHALSGTKEMYYFYYCSTTSSTPLGHSILNPDQHYCPETTVYNKIEQTCRPRTAQDNIDNKRAKLFGSGRRRGNR